MTNSKDEFAKKLEDSINAKEQQDKLLTEDISAFKEAVNNLEHEIKLWLKEFPTIKVTSNLRKVTDDTCNNRTYEVTDITINNDRKSISFKPDKLYYFGAMGGVNIIFNNKNIEQIFLNKNKDCFVFNDTKHLNGNISISEKAFNEEEFFKIMQNIT